MEPYRVVLTRKVKLRAVTTVEAESKEAAIELANRKLTDDDFDEFIPEPSEWFISGYLDDVSVDTAFPKRIK